MRREEKTSGAALLWDESFLWGVMAHRALRSCGLPFDLVRAEDVKQGALAGYRLLFVPGGWASNKIKALGSDGVDAIKRFVREGGSYLGFCGGAGLATEDGLGLLPVKRRPTQERVPSFSGPIGLKTGDHRIWEGLQSTGLRTPDAELVFHAWWPSQFVVDGAVSVLATYGDALPDAFSSDINVGDAEQGGGWLELERIYGINLDPKRLLDEPAVIEGGYGAGRVVLSLVHFDTPGDGNGAVVLGNLWKYLAPDTGRGARSADSKTANKDTSNSEVIRDIEAAVNDLIALGRRNFLWFRRNPMLLQWRRGVRGLEYCTLSILVNETAALLGRQGGKSGVPDLDGRLKRIRTSLLTFGEKAKRLLARERFALQAAHITYERCDDPEIQALREELFSLSKSHGGSFKALVDEMDGLLYLLLKEAGG